MADPRLLLIRMGSLGDVVHALPTASALRDSFPGARIDWAIEPKWTRILLGNPGINEQIPIDRKSAGGIVAAVRRLRAAKYTAAIDFQSLYKSALVALASGARRRIGFPASYAREGLAARLYTDCVHPRGAHKVSHNLTLAEYAGARPSPPRFPLAILDEDENRVDHELRSIGIRDFFVLNPGGGWRSKCWPPERYGDLHRRLVERCGWRGIVCCGPGEEELGREVVRAAGQPSPALLQLGLGPLLALLRRARFVVSADTGPLHLAAALRVPVIALFGPTDPSRNGPYGWRASGGVVLRNPQFAETTYRRGANYSPSMLSITVEQVLDAAERCTQAHSHS